MTKKTLTIAMSAAPGGWVKATVYEGTNTYLFTTYGVNENDALLSVSSEYALVGTAREGVNVSLNTRD